MVQQYDPSKMTIRELLDLYRGVDMRPMTKTDYYGFAGASKSARIGSTDDMVIIEDPETGSDGVQAGLFFQPTNDQYPCAFLLLTFGVS